VKFVEDASRKNPPAPEKDKEAEGETVTV
jgi:hypothetical protein